MTAGNLQLQPSAGCIGILMLDTRFPRIPGDAGNEASWPLPVAYRRITGASASLVLQADAPSLRDQFVQAARELVADGATGITTTCGFLSLLQDELKAAVAVPVAASSLAQIPWVQTLLRPDQRVGVLTIDAGQLDRRHLIAAGADPATPMAGTENGHTFTRSILEDRAELDVAACRQDNLAAAEDLVQRHPEVGAIVLECTNMVPYAADIHALTGRPVYSIYTLVCWFQAGLLPRRFENP